MSHHHKRKRDPRRIRKTATPKYQHILAYPSTIFFPVESEIKDPTPTQIREMAIAAVKPALDEFEDLDFDLMPSWVDVAPFDPSKLSDSDNDLFWIADTSRVQEFFVLELQTCEGTAPTVKEFPSEAEARHGLFNYVKANYAIGLGEQPPTVSAEQLIATYYAATDEHYVLCRVNPDSEQATKFECSCGLEENSKHPVVHKVMVN